LRARGPSVWAALVAIGKLGQRDARERLVALAGSNGDRKALASKSKNE
jgi:hypothetical protein